MTTTSIQHEALAKGLVSIIIAFYNAEAFLAEAIDSVLAQTYTQWELLLVDDGSSDSGPQIAHRYAAQHPNRIFCLAHTGHRNLGMCTSRNLGVRHSKGQYVAVLDSDDIWLPRKLEEQTSLMEVHPEVGLVYGSSSYWYDWAGDRKQISHKRVPPTAPPGRVYRPPELLKLCYPLGAFNSPCPSDFLLRREVLDEISGFEEAFDPEHQHYEDQAFLAKIYLHTLVFVSSERWHKYRIHDNSWSAISDKSGRSETTRQFYFKWLQQYLRDNHILDEEIWRSVRRCTRPYRHSWLTAQLRRIRSMINRCRVLIRFSPRVRKCGR